MILRLIEMLRDAPNLIRDLPRRMFGYRLRCLDCGRRAQLVTRPPAELWLNPTPYCRVCHSHLDAATRSLPYRSI